MFFLCLAVEGGAICVGDPQSEDISQTRQPNLGGTSFLTVQTPTWVGIPPKGSAHHGYISLPLDYRFLRKKRSFFYITVLLNWYCIQKRLQNHFKASEWDEQRTVQCWIMSTSLRLLWVAAILLRYCSKLRQITKISEKVGKNFWRLMISTWWYFQLKYVLQQLAFLSVFWYAKLTP